MTITNLFTYIYIYIRIDFQIQLCKLVKLQLMGKLHFLYVPSKNLQKYIL